MERGISDKNILDEFTEEFCSIVEKHCKYIICSGFVAIAHGRTRGTEDIDMVIEKLSKERFKSLHKDLIKSGFVYIQSKNIEEIYDNYLVQKDSVRYVRNTEGFFPPEMEIKFANDKLDEEQLYERIKLPLTHLNIYFASVESNIAFKEEYLKSEKDLEDARHLRIVYDKKIDEDKINKIKEKIKKIKLKNKG